MSDDRNLRHAKSISCKHDKLFLIKQSKRRVAGSKIIIHCYAVYCFQSDRDLLLSYSESTLLDWLSIHQL